MHDCEGENDDKMGMGDLSITRKERSNVHCTVRSHRIMHDLDGEAMLDWDG
jgi:hypothetical protein